MGPLISYLVFSEMALLMRLMETVSPALLGERDSSGLGGTKVQGPQAGKWEERKKLRLKRVLGWGVSPG